MNKTKILEEYDNHFARDYATDGEYTEEQMIKVQSDIIKGNVEWSRTFLSTTIDTLIGEIEGEVEGMGKNLVPMNETPSVCNPRCHDSGKDEILSDILTLLATYKQ